MPSCEDAVVRDCLLDILRSGRPSREGLCLLRAVHELVRGVWADTSFSSASGATARNGIRYLGPARWGAPRTSAEKRRAEYSAPVIDIASPDDNEDGRAPPSKRWREEDDNGEAKSARGTKETADIDNANSQREGPRYQRKAEMGICSDLPGFRSTGEDCEI